MCVCLPSIGSCSLHCAEWCTEFVFTLICWRRRCLCAHLQSDCNVWRHSNIASANYICTRNSNSCAHILFHTHTHNISAHTSTCLRGEHHAECEQNLKECVTVIPKHITTITVLFHSEVGIPSHQYISKYNWLSGFAILDSCVWKHHLDKPYRAKPWHYESGGIRECGYWTESTRNWLATRTMRNHSSSLGSMIGPAFRCFVSMLLLVVFFPVLWEKLNVWFIIWWYCQGEVFLGISHFKIRFYSWCTVFIWKHHPVYSLHSKCISNTATCFL